MLNWSENELLEHLRRIAAGEVELIDGCRAVVSLLPSLPREIAQSSAARVFAGVVSETEDIPIGRVRDVWNTDVLTLADVEVAAYRESVRNTVHTACKELGDLVHARVE